MMSPIMPTYGRLDVRFVRGVGATLFDDRSEAYLDALSGIAVTNLGHCHPALTAAMTQQVNTLLHTSNLYHIPAQEQLADTLTQATAMQSVFFCNSGAEANETALKLIRLYGHQRDVAQPLTVVLEGAFHGRTFGALSATGNARIRDPFAPLLPGFLRIPREDLTALDALATTHPDIVAVHVEPVQGEGGVHALSHQFLSGLRARCDARGWLLSFDEVQSGNGRCGSLYAYQRLGVRPDILATAKGLGNGMPIGACLVTGAASAVLGPGDHGTTFGGNPLACVAGQAVMDTLQRDALWHRADPLRECILAGFNSRLTAPEAVAEIRGLGLMLGIALNVDCSGLVRRALEKKLLINVTSGNTIRLLPPLVMSEAEATRTGELVADVVNAVVNEQGVIV